MIQIYDGETHIFVMCVYGGDVTYLSWDICQKHYILICGYITLYDRNITDKPRRHGESWSSLTLKVLVATIDAQWEGMGDVGSVRYEPTLLPLCPIIRVLSYSN